jgi:hypothetical protein
VSVCNKQQQSERRCGEAQSSENGICVGNCPSTFLYTTCLPTWYKMQDVALILQHAADFELFSALGLIACNLCYGSDTGNALHYQDKLVSRCFCCYRCFHGLIASSISHHHQSASQSQNSFGFPSRKPECIFGIGIKCGELLNLPCWNTLVTDWTRSHVLIQ